MRIQPRSIFTGHRTAHVPAGGGDGQFRSGDGGSGIGREEFAVAVARTVRLFDSFLFDVAVGLVRSGAALPGRPAAIRRDGVQFVLRRLQLGHRIARRSLPPADQEGRLHILFRTSSALQGSYRPAITSAAHSASAARSGTGRPSGQSSGGGGGSSGGYDRSGLRRRHECNDYGSVDGGQLVLRRPSE